MRAKNVFVRFIFISVVLFFSVRVSAQFPQAAHLVLNGDYEGGKSFYIKVLEKDSLNFEANQELGLLLVQYFDDKDHALFYLNRAVRCINKKELLPELYMGFAQALHHDSQYKPAITYYEKIISLLPNNAKGAQIKNQALRNIENCNYGIKNPPSKSSSKYRIKNPGNGINTAYPEFSPVVDPENSTLMYTARRNIVLGDKKEGPEDKSHGEMFIANRLTGKFESGMPFFKPNFPVKFLESAENQDAVIAMSTNGEHLLIYRADQIFLTELKDGKWTSPVRLPGTVNSAVKFEGSACISNDGKTIYFSASKIGGYGGKDLYKSVLTEKGEWSEAENLGEDINTGEDEDSPFLNFSENTLYYSSKGLSGFGGYDIYKTKISHTAISKPVNMGIPFNSPADDINFWLNKNESEAYLASSRKGGYGDLDIYHVLYFDKAGENCVSVNNSQPGDDVPLDFTFRDSVFINDLVSFSAVNSKIKNGNVLNYFWKVNDTTSAGDTLFFFKKFPQEGKQKISLQVAVYSETDESRKDYCISKELHVFSPHVVDVFFEPLVKANEEKMAIKGTVDVTKMKIDSSKKEVLTIKLEPVFFNTNKFDLRKDAIEAIKRNIAKMKVDASIVVKLTALTDPRSGKEYNLQLSQKRANSVMTALEKSGIKRKRIIAVLALGEEDANIKSCNGDATCLEKVYQQNRRVEFKIVGAEYTAPKSAIPASAKKGTKKNISKKAKK
ncbi:MAG TPA: OmpA family protein [Bacteroidia bacterium]|jgi:outer membrane protein OmpA-like peptidoglycan-associated protein/tetratricopeptide (TPR) repeat protein|nr:OmpA family protein [Bacteroidia bacterium]